MRIYKGTEIQMDLENITHCDRKSDENCEKFYEINPEHFVSNGLKKLFLYLT